MPPRPSLVTSRFRPQYARPCFAITPARTKAFHAHDNRPIKANAMEWSPKRYHLHPDVDGWKAGFEDRFQHQGLHPLESAAFARRTLARVRFFKAYVVSRLNTKHLDRLPEYVASRARNHVC